MPRHPSLDNILPFTPADDARIQRTGKFVAVPKLKVPANLSGFDLTRLTTPTTLAWPPELPARDPRGHPSAPKYRPWKKAADSKVGIAGNYYSFKAGRIVPCHSALERRFLACAEFDPNIVEIRAQYGLWNRHEYLEYKRAGLRMPAKSKITLDFMVTFTDGVGHHYHAVNIKPYLLALKPPALKRLGNEFSLVDSWGITHQVLTEHSMPSQTEVNCRRLFANMRFVEDIGAYQVHAIALAECMLQQEVLGTVDWEMTNAAEHFGWSRHETYRIFSIANYLGYMRLNHTYDFLPYKPLHLHRPDEPILNFWSNPWPRSAQNTSQILSDSFRLQLTAE